MKQRLLYEMNKMQYTLIFLGLILCLPFDGWAAPQSVKRELTIDEVVALSVKRLPPLQMATAQAQAERAEQLRLRTHNIKRGFYAALYAQFLSGEQLGGLQFLDDWIGIVSKRVEAGATPASELEKLKVERAQLADARSQSQLQLRLAMLQLQSDLCVPAADWEVRGTWQTRLPVLDFSTLLNTAYTTRPDLQMAYLRHSGAAEVTALRGRIAAEVEAAVALCETYRTLPTRLQLNQLPRVVDVLGTEDTRYYEKLSSLAPLLEAARTRRAERERWIRAQYQLQLSLLALEAAIGKSLTP